MTLTNHLISPIAIGGVGGSGTRIIAKILMELGYHMGDDLNHENDNLWFTLLFKRPEITHVSDNDFINLYTLFLKGMKRDKTFTKAEIDVLDKLSSHDRLQHPKEWLRHRVELLVASNSSEENISNWGWKEPNTHIILDKLFTFSPNIKYIHVMRNGLDMAHSRNQNQLEFWGEYFFGNEYKITPYYSLKYWCHVHKRVIEICNSAGGEGLILNYDTLCNEPMTTIQQLLEFIGVESSRSNIKKLSNIVVPPSSIGRYKTFGLDIFDPVDVNFVKQLGFDIN